MKCLSCKKKEILPIYNFGKIPLVNSFSKKFRIANKKYILDLVVCKNCKTCQLNKAPHGDAIFKNYKYFSSASVDTVKHFKKVAHFIKKNFPKCENILEYTDDFKKIVEKNNNKKIVEDGDNTTKMFM